ncbi:unnamed protein product, partial [Hapterophycus canaliculatus]
QQQPNPSFLKERAAKFDAIAAKQKERLAQKPKQEITILLPDGTEKKGVSYETTPMDIAKVIFSLSRRGLSPALD